jgi:hypothetical protein
VKELANGILAEIIETPGLPQEDIFNMFSTDKGNIIDALNTLYNNDLIEWRIDKSDTCWYPTALGIAAHDATKIADNDTDIPF